MVCQDPPMTNGPCYCNWYIIHLPHISVKYISEIYQWNISVKNIKSGGQKYSHGNLITWSLCYPIKSWLAVCLIQKPPALLSHFNCYQLLPTVSALNSAWPIPLTVLKIIIILTTMMMKMIKGVMMKKNSQIGNSQSTESLPWGSVGGGGVVGGGPASEYPAKYYKKNI